MGNSVCMNVTIELQSDSIFGCGFSIPAEEDISVKRDKDGYPVLGGQTFKGLLRESMTDYIAWTEGDSTLIDNLLGKEGFTQLADARHINLTDFTVADKSEDPEEYFITRAFTAIEDGMAKEGSLRLAECIVRGTKFCGNIYCLKEDVALIVNSLKGIKWLGTMRNRGFGRVKITAEEIPFDNKTEISGTQTEFIKYVITAESPVCLTDLACSHGTYYETKHYIPGSVIRGLIVNSVKNAAPDEFSSYKRNLLQRVSVGNAIATFTEQPAIPTPKGFYEAKDGSNFENILYVEDLTPQNKRASLGCAAALDNDQIKFYVPQTGGAMCMNRRLSKDEKKGGLYEKRWIEAGEVFTGYIHVEDAAIGELLKSALTEEVIWIGASQGGGFGKCSIQYSFVDEPEYFRYGVGNSDEVVNEFTMMAFSPITMLDEYGESCGIDVKALETKLGLSNALEIVKSATSVSSYQGYNRAWGTRTEAERMYDAGSMFVFKSSEPIAKKALYELQCEGIGIRKPEGYGQILIVEGLDKITGKHIVEKTDNSKTDKYATEIKRKEALARMIQEKSKVIPRGLSKAQIGSLQALLEGRYDSDEAARRTLDEFYDHNEEKKPKYAEKFIKMRKFTDEFFAEKEYVSLFEVDSVRARMKALAAVFNYSRREGR